jgi:hypothetical protein
MKRFWLLAAIVVGGSQLGFALNDPSLVREDPRLSSLACIDANFSHSQQIAGALRNGGTNAILQVLADALTELQKTPATNDLYPARAFCIHELVPPSLSANTDASLRTVPTAEVKQFESLGMEYFFYEPDARWNLREDPVDFVRLATRRLDSRWGREAFVMMTHLGWSEGGCREGPNQFLEVIQRSKRFLNEFPESEVSAEVRLSMANAYATWWNLSREDANSLRANNPVYAERLDKSREGANSDSSSVNPYDRGAEEAKDTAIELYREYLTSRNESDQEVQVRLKDLLDNPHGSNTFDYFCGGYED